MKKLKLSVETGQVQNVERTAVRDMEALKQANVNYAGCKSPVLGLLIREHGVKVSYSAVAKGTEFLFQYDLDRKLALISNALIGVGFQFFPTPRTHYRQPMPIPTLEPNGLLPTGVHECSLADISEQFTWNDHRTGLFTRFVSFLDAELKPQFPYAIYFDGSFVTDKELPDDTDVVLDLALATDEHKWHALMFMHKHQQRIMEVYRVHFWINFPGENDFAAYFQYIGVKTASAKGLNPHHLKGILKVS